MEGLGVKWEEEREVKREKRKKQRGQQKEEQRSRDTQPLARRSWFQQAAEGARFDELRERRGEALPRPRPEGRHGAGTPSR